MSRKLSIRFRFQKLLYNVRFPKLYSFHQRSLTTLSLSINISSIAYQILNNIQAFSPAGKMQRRTSIGINDIRVSSTLNAYLGQLKAFWYVHTCYDMQWCMIHMIQTLIRTYSLIDKQISKLFLLLLEDRSKNILSFKFSIDNFFLLIHFNFN